jgi:hypothetical protein
VEFRPRKRKRKRKRKRTLQCPSELLPVLPTHRTEQAKERLAADGRWQDHNLIFATLRGYQLTEPTTGVNGTPS